MVISYKNAETLIVERENEISDINYQIKQTLTGRVFSHGREKVGFAVGLNANLATYQQWGFR